MPRLNAILQRPLLSTSSDPCGLPFIIVSFQRNGVVGKADIAFGGMHAKTIVLGKMQPTSSPHSLSLSAVAASSSSKRRKFTAGLATKPFGRKPPARRCIHDIPWRIAYPPLTRSAKLSMNPRGPGHCRINTTSASPHKPKGSKATASIGRRMSQVDGFMCEV